LSVPLPTYVVARPQTIKGAQTLERAVIRVTPMAGPSGLSYYFIISPYLSLFFFFRFMYSLYDFDAASGDRTAPVTGKGATQY
jgi:hypothetical protein